MKKLIILLFAFTLAACDLQGSLFSSEPNFEGTYGHGSTPAIKVTKVSGEYYISTRELGDEDWSIPKETNKMSKEFWNSKFTPPLPDSASGIYLGSAIVVVVPKGTIVRGRKVSTGYFGGTGKYLMPLGELVKLD